MQISDLIKQLIEIQKEHGDIPIYETEAMDDDFGCNSEIIDYMKTELKPVQIYIREYTKEYYDYRLDEVVTEEYNEYDESPIGERLPSDAQEAHIGLIL